MVKDTLACGTGWLLGQDALISFWQEIYSQLFSSWRLRFMPQLSMNEL
jgi:hypothetical protein